MHTTAVIGLALGLVSASVAAAQTPLIGAEQEYLFLDVVQTGTLQKELAAAGSQGFAVHSSSRFCVIMKREGAGPRSYRVVAATRDTTLIKELNDASAQGFQLLRNGVMTWADEWIVILEKRPDGARFTYTGVKGDDSAQQGLDAARRSGGTVVAVLGKPPSEYSLRGGNPPPLLILEQSQGIGAPPEDARPREYRIVSTQRTSTLEKEVMDATPLGFRVIGSGFMTVVMERDPTAPSAVVERRVIATTRLPTFERELKEAGAKGFRVVAIPEKNNEIVAVVERTTGTAPRVEFTLEVLREKTADAQLRRLASTESTFAGLFGQLVLFERIER